jgi:N utilization substance protein B
MTIEPKKTSQRRLIRETVLQGLYAQEIAKDPPQHIIETLFGDLKKNSDYYQFAIDLFLKTTQHQTECDKLIKSKAEHWDFYRIALIDKILLRIAVCELLFFPEIPPKVSINEAIEIAKEFSTDNSGTFINGILDSILDELQKKKMLTKTGRGLFNTAAKK